MPYIPHTPEALLGRSDSKNPATTCKGLTSSGRPCRRALAAGKTSGVLAVVSVDDENDAAAFFCWQHKDQATQLAQGSNLGAVAEETHVVPLRERTSVDTLVQRLGVIELEDGSPSKGKTRKERRSSRPANHDRPPRIARPPTWEAVQGPVMSVPTGVIQSSVPAKAHRTAKAKRGGFWSSLCCGGGGGGGDNEDDYVELVRHRRRRQSQMDHVASLAAPQMSQAPKPTSNERNSRRHSRQSRPVEHHASSQPGTPQSAVPARKPLGPKTPRPLNLHAASADSPTSNLLSWIPTDLSPQVTSSLLNEMAKPVSVHDEPGYIYIFWLTPSTTAPPPTRTASTLLSAHPDVPRGRRASDVLSSYAGSVVSSAMQEPDSKSILLKVGRASNVHRRMNEWTRQCGYELSLVRFYPHVSSSPAPSPSPRARTSLQPGTSPRSTTQRQSSDTSVRKVPHAHRVERLIHLELAERRVKKSCDACGKEHREWFEVDASMDGVKKVDEVIKRWVRWGEHAGS